MWAAFVLIALWQTADLEHVSDAVIVNNRTICPETITSSL